MELDRHPTNQWEVPTHAESTTSETNIHLIRETKQHMKLAPFKISEWLQLVRWYRAPSGSRVQWEKSQTYFTKKVNGSGWPGKK